MENYGKVKRKRYFGFILALLSGVIAVMMFSSCGKTRTYTVAGKITSGGVALPGVTVALSGDTFTTTTTTTDANGNYTFSNVSGGIYKATPSVAESSFAVFIPSYRDVFLDGFDAIGFNFSRSGQGRIAATNHTIALKGDGALWDWGNNSNGQLGNGSTAQSSVPLQVSGMTGVLVAAGNTHTAALKSDHTVWTWGNNSSGQLGDGTTTQRLVPVQVSGLPLTIKAIAAGSDHTVALSDDGTVWTWGNNSNGQLGDGTTTQRLTPVQVINLTGVTAIAAGSAHTVVLKNDGTVWAWGNNSNGQLGNGNLTQSATAVQVSGLTNVVAVAAGFSHTAALRNDVTDVSVWVWGNNASGQLGNGTTTQSSVPVQATGLSGITAIAAGHDHTVVLKNDGTVWIWGSNSNGQLGIGSTVQSLVAVQVSGMTNAMAVAAGYTHTVVLKNDDTVWTWGGNGNGQLGNGTTTDSLTPVQANF